MVRLRIDARLHERASRLARLLGDSLPKFATDALAERIASLEEQNPSLREWLDSAEKIAPKLREGGE